ncbi:type II toxin-antitoxin system RelE/ParE family toxin [Eubacteriaceae bacterium ES2]|nr:type II toxin-antitoxin system RelE/ParE family toxin [Eubacteriaceae bacterium ES2]
MTELAHRDLDEIVSYISVELSNNIAAANFLDEVEKCYALLRSNPRMYEKCRDGHLVKEGYRRALIKTICLFTKLTKTKKQCRL